MNQFEAAQGEAAYHETKDGLSKPCVSLANDRYVEWKVTVPEDGLYQLKVEYFMEQIEGERLSAVRKLLIDGKLPFSEANTITFYRYFRDDGTLRYNNLGDQIRPSQIEVPGVRTMLVRDSLGYETEPLKFYFSAGEHKIRLEYVDRTADICGIWLTAPRSPVTYNEYLNAHGTPAPIDLEKTIEVEAESSILEKNDPTMRIESNGDSACVPTSYGIRKLNTFGGSSWSKGAQTVTWSIEVPITGYYQLGMRFSTTWADGMPTYRQFLLDGEVPFEELECYQFDFDRHWQNRILSDENGRPYYLYLEAGRQHTLTMRTVFGDEVSEIIQGVYYDAVTMSDIIRQIVLITSNDPDPNYEYFLEKKIPNLLDRLGMLKASVSDKFERMNALATKRPALANRLNLLIKQLDEMIESPHLISRRLNDIKEAQTALGTLYESLQSSALIVDYFRLDSIDREIDMPKSNFFTNLAPFFVNLFQSFTRDYDNIAGLGEASEDAVVLNVWASQGQEWAELIKEMADEQFSAKQNVYINLNLLPQSQLNVGSVNALMLALASNNEPDIALGILNNSPVELAIRDAVYDLSTFPDFEQVKARFVEAMMTPLEYNGGTYAIPETMNFRVLIYRKDIMSEIGASIPDTWDDVYNRLIPALSESNMKFYVPQDFGMFLYQHGGEYYRDNGLVSDLDTPEAYQAFKEYTELFTNYNIPIVADFYNRMRIGEIPIGIGSFDDYIKITSAAPELNGKWGIALVPGHKREDGTIDRTITGMIGNADMILGSTEHPKEAWEFLKWWSDTKTQTQFGQEIEALLGKTARWCSANKEAFRAMPWKQGDFEIISQTWPSVKETPVVLGGYITSRYVSNAWNSVVVAYDMTPREAIDNAVESINRELQAKQEEYGITQNSK